jgi:hypothetical protein
MCWWRIAGCLTVAPFKGARVPGNVVGDCSWWRTDGIHVTKGWFRLVRWQNTFLCLLFTTATECFTKTIKPTGLLVGGEFGSEVREPSRRLFLPHTPFFSMRLVFALSVPRVPYKKEDRQPYPCYCPTDDSANIQRRRWLSRITRFYVSQPVFKNGDC